MPSSPTTLTTSMPDPSQEAKQRLGHYEELAQVHTVGHRPTPRAEQQRGDPPNCQDQPEIAWRAGEIEDGTPSSSGSDLRLEVCHERLSSRFFRADTSA
jgi:hypothetical protein